MKRIILLAAAIMMSLTGFAQFPGGGFGGGMPQGGPSEQNSYDYDKQQQKYDKAIAKILTEQLLRLSAPRNSLTSTTPVMTARFIICLTSICLRRLRISIPL